MGKKKTGATPAAARTNAVPPASSVDVLDKTGNDYIILHRIGGILLSLLDKTIVKDKKYPQEASLVNEMLHQFIQNKVREVYGFGDSALEEVTDTLITKDQAQSIIQEMIDKVRGTKSGNAENVKSISARPAEKKVETYNEEIINNAPQVDSQLSPEQQQKLKRLRPKRTPSHNGSQNAMSSRVPVGSANGFSMDQIGDLAATLAVNTINNKG